MKPSSSLGGWTSFDNASLVYSARTLGFQPGNDRFKPGTRYQKMEIWVRVPSNHDSGCSFNGRTPSLNACITQLVECYLAKVNVEGSSPFARSRSGGNTGSSLVRLEIN